MTHAESVARNIIKTYGPEGLERLVNMLEAGDSFQSIAGAFHVTRQRVFQWAQAIGVKFRTYQLHPVIEELSR